MREAIGAHDRGGEEEEEGATADGRCDKEDSATEVARSRQCAHRMR
jgi:hypothetical protein